MSWPRWTSPAWSSAKQTPTVCTLKPGGGITFGAIWTRKCWNLLVNWSIQSCNITSFYFVFIYSRICIEENFIFCYIFGFFKSAIPSESLMRRSVRFFWKSRIIVGEHREIKFSQIFQQNYKKDFLYFLIGKNSISGLTNFNLEVWGHISNFIF